MFLLLVVWFYGLKTWKFIHDVTAEIPIRLTLFSTIWIMMFAVVLLLVQIFIPPSLYQNLLNLLIAFVWASYLHNGILVCFFFVAILYVAQELDYLPRNHPDMVLGFDGCMTLFVCTFYFFRVPSLTKKLESKISRTELLNPSSTKKNDGQGILCKYCGFKPQDAVCKKCHKCWINGNLMDENIDLEIHPVCDLKPESSEPPTSEALLSRDSFRQFRRQFTMSSDSGMRSKTDIHSKTESKVVKEEQQKRRRQKTLNSIMNLLDKKRKESYSLSGSTAASDYRERTPSWTPSPSRSEMSVCSTKSIYV